MVNLADSLFYWLLCVYEVTNLRKGIAIQEVGDKDKKVAAGGFEAIDDGLLLSEFIPCPLYIPRPFML